MEIFILSVRNKICPGSGPARAFLSLWAPSVDLYAVPGPFPSWAIDLKAAGDQRQGGLGRVERNRDVPLVPELSVAWVRCTRSPARGHLGVETCESGPQVLGALPLLGPGVLNSSGHSLGGRQVGGERWQGWPWVPAFASRWTCTCSAHRGSCHPS